MIDNTMAKLKTDKTTSYGENNTTQICVPS